MGNGCKDKFSVKGFENERRAKKIIGIKNNFLEFLRLLDY